MPAGSRRAARARWVTRASRAPPRNASTSSSRNAASSVRLQSRRQHAPRRLAGDPGQRIKDRTGLAEGVIVVPSVKGVWLLWRFWQASNTRHDTPHPQTSSPRVMHGSSGNHPDRYRAPTKWRILGRRVKILHNLDYASPVLVCHDGGIPRSRRLHGRADCQDQLLGHCGFDSDNFHQGRKPGCGSGFSRQHVEP